MSDYVVNPLVVLKFFGAVETFTIPAAGPILDENLAVEFTINKDLDEDPNDATLLITNFSEGTRGKMITAADQYTPVEIWLTPHESTTLTLAYRGEIDYATSRFLNPGWETEIFLLSQAIAHRAAYVDKKTFGAGTYVADMFDFFIDKIGLPRGKVEQLDEPPGSPTGAIERYHKIPYAESYTGAAFYLLRQRALEVGQYAYIQDGTINITNVFDPEDPTIFAITSAMTRFPPEVTSRIDERGVEVQAIYESVTVNPLAKRRRKRIKNKWARRVKDIKRFGDNQYTDYEAVDAMVPGANFEIFCQPALNPDNFVSCESEGFADRLFRVTEVEHYGNSDDFSDWDTVLVTDEYDSTEGFEVEV